MPNPTETNLRIKAKGMYEDERELLSMLKAMYRNYWKVKETGDPILEEGNEGNQWFMSYRVHRMDNGEPHIEKEIYFKRQRGERIKLSDEVLEGYSKNPNLKEGVEKTRAILEKVAFLTTAYEIKERQIADIARIDKAAQDIDTLHTVEMGRVTRSLVEGEYPYLRENPQDTEVIEWKIIPELETWSTQEQELRAARESELRLPLPPSDDGNPRFEILEKPIESISKETQQPRIVWGSEGES